MQKDFEIFSDGPQEVIVSIRPAVFAGVINLLLIVGASLLTRPDANGVSRLLLIVAACGGLLHFAFQHWYYNNRPDKAFYLWINTALAAIILTALTYFTPKELNYLVYSLVLIAALSSSVIADRGPAYLFIALFTLIHIMQHAANGISFNDWFIQLGFAVLSIVVVETVQHLKTLSQKQVKRLEIVNEISGQIASTLEAEQLIALLNAALQNALDADTYYIGIQEGDEVHMQLVYDDGEYFNDVKFKTKNTLYGWVIDSKKPLFLPNLKNTAKIEDINLWVIGKQKKSLSWMGVPMLGSHVKGVIAVASYRTNAFNRSDFELLSTITQRATLALDNARHHAQVEEQARLDSLTRVYNHSYFIKTLYEQADACLALNQPLSLIMLDIDHFKQYNDTFGHLVGDEILVSLCQVIRENIKQGDAVGRWGGEEFAISLPNAAKQQAHAVAERIRVTLADFKISDTRFTPIAVPTISMGIAEFPAETKDVNKLIDLADKRLYAAKERGRDQIESAL